MMSMPAPTIRARSSSTPNLRRPNSRSSGVLKITRRAEFTILSNTLSRRGGSSCMAGTRMARSATSGSPRAVVA